MKDEHGEQHHDHWAGEQDGGGVPQRQSGKTREDEENPETSGESNNEKEHRNSSVVSALREK